MIIINDEERIAIGENLIMVRKSIEQSLSGISCSWNEYLSIMRQLKRIFDKHPGLLKDFGIANFKVPGNIKLQNSPESFRHKILSMVLPVMDELVKAKENDWGLNEKNEIDESYSVLQFVATKCMSIVNQLPTSI